MRLAVTGRRGQLATALAERAGALGVAVTPIGRPDLDLADPSTIAPALRAARPDAVVNTAAYTAVDRAESEPGPAHAVNADGAGAVAAAARLLGVPVIHLSTDYVFDGGKATPYDEHDATGPMSVYGLSKLGGERAVAQASADHAILRTEWVYAPFGANFVRTMLRLAETRDEVAVVDDQHGCPTSAVDLADAIVAIARNLLDQPDDAALRGLFHVAAEGETTWAGFARAVFAGSAARGGPAARVRPIPSSEYPTPARRPLNSRLDCGKIARAHGVRLPPWPAGLDACLDRLVPLATRTGDGR